MPSFSSNGSGPTLTTTTIAIMVMIMIVKMFIKPGLELLEPLFQGLCTSPRAQVGPPRRTAQVVGAVPPLVLSPELWLRQRKVRLTYRIWVLESWTWSNNKYSSKGSLPRPCLYIWSLEKSALQRVLIYVNVFSFLAFWSYQKWVLFGFVNFGLVYHVGCSFLSFWVCPIFVFANCKGVWSIGGRLFPP